MCGELGPAELFKQGMQLVKAGKKKRSYSHIYTIYKKTPSIGISRQCLL